MSLRMPNGEPLNSRIQCMTRERRDKEIESALIRHGMALSLLANGIDHAEPFEVLERRMEEAKRTWRQVDTLTTHRIMTEQ